MQTPIKSELAEWRASKNFNARAPQLIIIHHTEMGDAESALQVLQTGNQFGPVSAHYLISRSGEIWQLVGDEQRAWHAGVSRWQGRADLNSISLGIELDNDGVAPFSERQIEALLRLLKDLCERHAIASHQIWGHADIAPGRKRDPHVGFPWQRLAEAGFGLWPRSDLRAPPEHFDPWLALHLIGYDLGDRAATVLAFKRHFRAQEHAELDSQDLAILFDLQSQLLEMAHRAKWPVYPAIP